MAIPRKRVRLEDGLKLDVNKLASNSAVRAVLNDLVRPYSRLRRLLGDQGSVQH